MSEKQLFLVLIGVAVLVAAVFGVLSYLDWNKIQEKEKQIAVIETDIRALSKKASGVPTLQKEIDALVASDREHRKALPVQRQDDILLKGFHQQAKEARITLTRCGFVDARVAPSSASQDPWQSFDVEIRASGYFFDLLTFMNRLEFYPRILSIESAKFALDSTAAREKEAERKKDEESPGPMLGIELLVKAYTFAQGPARPAAPGGAAPAPGTQPAPGGAGAPATPEVEAPEEPLPTVQIPEDSRIQVKNRRNPFEIQLKKKILTPTPEGGGPTPVINVEIEEAKAKLKEWTEKMNAIFTTITVGPADRVIQDWKVLVEEIEKVRFQGDIDKQRTTLLENVKKMRKAVYDAYEGHFQELCRKTLKDLQDLQQVGKYGEILSRYVELLKALFVLDAFPPRAQREMQAATEIYLETLRHLVRDEGDFATPIQEVDERLKKAVPAPWSKNAFVEGLLKEAMVYRNEAQSLVEFHKFNLLVSGIVWLPDKPGARRIAIVNDTAVLEGDPIPADRVLKLPPGSTTKPVLPSPVILEKVGRDRFVWFGYKGLTIRYPLGKKEKIGK